ncbi:MAG TPA: 2Fe-2S iron-sulfur cluster-binding protein [Usitatibacter sp.]|nr:2Fe-2S iron-sulfur cluster-binding protein [Usitatibacter sp.]
MSRDSHDPPSEARRRFVLGTGALGASLGAIDALGAPKDAGNNAIAPEATHRVRFKLNGETRELTLDPRVTLLDALRERLRMTGTKKGCDRGQCGACTVLVDGRRVNSCLTLAVTLEGKEVTTIEGLSRGGAAHPAQVAFLERDAFQCGYCTPGQIMSCVALVDEYRHGMPSYVSRDVRPGAAIALTDDEIRERMSGNICRCGAYVNIVAAVRDVAGGGKA